MKCKICDRETSENTIYSTCPHCGFELMGITDSELTEELMNLTTKIKKVISRIEYAKTPWTTD